MTISATVATPSRAKDNPAGPITGDATRIAGNALAHNTTTASPASSARFCLIRQACRDRLIRSSYY